MNEEFLLAAALVILIQVLFGGKKLLTFRDFAASNRQNHVVQKFFSI